MCLPTSIGAASSRDRSTSRILSTNCERYEPPMKPKPTTSSSSGPAPDLLVAEEGDRWWNQRMCINSRQQPTARRVTIDVQLSLLERLAAAEAPSRCTDQDL